MGKFVDRYMMVMMHILFDFYVKSNNEIKRAPRRLNASSMISNNNFFNVCNGNSNVFFLTFNLSKFRLNSIYHIKCVVYE